jgi:hypothetical protein
MSDSKKIIVCIVTLLLGINAGLNGQNPVIKRSVKAVAGSSRIAAILENKQLRVHYTIGQNSPTGQRKAYNTEIIQGFIQPRISKHSRSNEKPTVERPFKIYPNPFTNKTAIHFFGNPPENSRITITNMLGQNVFSKDFFNKNPIEIKLSHIPIGQYILKVTSKNKSYSSCIIKIE